MTKDILDLTDADARWIGIIILLLAALGWCGR